MILKARTIGRLGAMGFFARINIPLYRNGYALILSSGLTAGMGMLYWVLAARFYPPEVVGRNSAVLSAMLFLAGLAQLGVNNVLVRYLPIAGTVSRRLISSGYLLSLLVSITASTIFLIGIDLWSPALQGLRAGPTQAIGFVAATATWCIFGLQDSVLTGMRRARIVPIENAAYSVAKLAILIVATNSIRDYGIFVAWVLPVIVGIPWINILIFRRFLPEHSRATGGHQGTLALGELARYLGGNYLGGLFFSASTTLLPILVLNQAGPAASAHFYLPWTIASTLQLVTLNMSTSLTVEAMTDQAALYSLVRRTLIHTLAIVGPLVAGIMLCAPLILGMFGSEYASTGVAILRLFSLAAIPHVFTSMFIGLARVEGRARHIAIVHGSLCAAALALGYLLLRRIGVIGVGWAWLGGQAIVAVVVFPSLLRAILRAHSERGGSSGV